MKLRHFNNSTCQRGYTLLELALVLVIISVLATIAYRSGQRAYDQSRLEQTKAEMERLAFAIAGDPDLVSAGIRTNFGYIGDNGAMPPDLDALVSNPGLGTWNGPYIKDAFQASIGASAYEFKIDAWGESYGYSGGVDVASNGGGAALTHRLANSVNDLLYNEAAFNIVDIGFHPPGAVYKDSVAFRLTYPNGSGAAVTSVKAPSSDGFVAYDSLPIGIHHLKVAFSQTGDTLTRRIAILPARRYYERIQHFDELWGDTSSSPGGGGGGSLTMVGGSDSLLNDCHGFRFWISNTTGGPITIGDITVSWTGLTAYYRQVRWGNNTVVSQTNPQIASGETVDFDDPQTIEHDTMVRITVDNFRSSINGGSNVDIDNTTFTVTLSDGSSFEINTEDCP